MSNTKQDPIFKRGPWQPLVFDQAEGLVLHVPIESGFLGFNLTFAILPADLAVLREDDERYYLLFAYLHHVYQMRSRVACPVQDPLIARILHGPQEEVAALLTATDRDSNGAVANLASKYLDRDYKSFRAGRWFSTPEPPA